MNEAPIHAPFDFLNAPKPIDAQILDALLRIEVLLTPAKITDIPTPTRPVMRRK